MSYIENARKLRPIVEQAMQSVDGNDALTAKMLYPTFAEIIGKTVKQGFKFSYGDKLYKTAQPEMTIMEHYPPDIGTESLYTEICEVHTGTIADPIPYDGNMALEQGKYYAQDGMTYLCIRDTVNPVYHPLADLVGLYVENVEQSEV